MKQLLSLVLGSLLITPAYGAFGAGTVWRISTVSSSVNNGGGYDPGVVSPGTDESSNTGVAITITTASTTTGTGSPAITSTTHGPGNFVHIASGTGCNTGYYEILSQAAGTATFDHAIAAAGGDTCVGVIGGPFATPQTATGQLVTGNTVCVKADGTYSISTQITFSASGNAATPVTFKGYTSTCGTGNNVGDGGSATLQITANSINSFNIGQQFIQISNLIIDVNSHTNGSPSLFWNQPNIHIENVVVKNGGSGAGGLGGGNDATVVNSRVTGFQSGCTFGFNSTGGTITYLGDVADSNACTGFSDGSGTLLCYACISANNSGGSSHGFQWGVTNAQTACISCIAYGNGGNGFDFGGSTAAGNGGLMYNNWAWGNAGHAISAGAAVTQQLKFDYNAYVSGGLNNIGAGPHDVILSADPSTNGASLNFTLNNTAGGGAAIKGLGFPSGAFFSSTAYMTIGAIQPQVNGTGTIGGGSFAYVQ